MIKNKFLTEDQIEAIEKSESNVQMSELRKAVMIELIRKHTASISKDISTPIPLEYECELICNYIIGRTTIDLEKLVKAYNKRL